MQISPIFKSGHKHTLTHTHGFLDSVYGLLITSGMENQFLPWSDLFTPWLGPGLGLGLILGSSLVPDQWELMTSLASDALPPDFYLDRSCLVSRHLQTSFPPTVLTPSQSPVLDLGNFWVAGFPLPF